MLDELDIDCPYCGAHFTALIEPDDADSDYIQDCEICCHPIHFRVRDDGGGGLQVEVARDDDS
ncbi:MAG: CPXCG motif-containing cysteine-rich protein [Halofilum sp. (in: g-proteobacteria)]|nr:CPXCG motif-containing cysteine-rich protein [Halofilum sp. (in: g-proteobacteria)]